MSVVSVVCCQVKVSATSWSLVQRSPTDCDASLCVIEKPQEWGGEGPRRAEALKGGGGGTGKGGLQVAILLIMQVSRADIYFFPYFLNVQN